MAPVYNHPAMEKALWEQRRWLITAVILLFWGLALTSMANDSITMDEQNHIGRGVGFVNSGDPRLSLEHPPLANSLSALPLLLVPDLNIPFDHTSWDKQPPDIYWYIFADQLLWQRGNDVETAVFLARIPIILLTLGLALVGYRFGLALWKRPSALLIIPLLLFDPNLMAHGRYVTTDMGGTVFIFLATFLLWRLWQQAVWSWHHWAWAVLGMGLAFSSKLSALVFVPIWLGMAIWPLSGRRSLQKLFWFLTAGLASIAVVWVVFGFEWGLFFFKTPILQSLNSVQGPMPTFWAGVEQITLISTEGRMAYLNGRFQQGGFNNYFPITFAIKTPIVLLIAFALAAFLLIRQDDTRGRATFVLIPILAYFVISMQSGLNIGYRHLLPILPFIYLLIIGDWRWGIREQGIENKAWGSEIGLPFTVLVAVCILAINLWIYPNYLSYFNQLIGGPENGAQWLLDSNVDWGQDLIRLREWMTDNEVESVRLGWFGTADPAYYGVPNQPLPGFPRAEYLSQWTVPPFNVVAPEPGIY
ncbi:MAG: glycosyltransferase family 39 protein, partial [Chloroflexota bacterium]